MRAQQVAARGTRRPATVPTMSRCMPHVRGIIVVPRLTGNRTFPRRPSTIVCAAGGVAHPGEEASRGEEQNSGFQAAFLSVPDVTMAKGGGGGRDMGSGSALGAVLERSKLEFVMPTPPQQAPKLDDGGSGGDDGKHLNNGGGGGDGGDDDDDDFFGEGDGDGDGNGGGGGGGDGFFRTALPELYDRLSVGAVLAEWFKTVAELPAFIRRAVEMGLYSSAQLTRFLAMDVRPNVTRTVSRALPPSVAREFVGRLMADPGFMQKLVMEQLMAMGFSLWHEWRVRGEAFRSELDLVAINTLGMMAATGAAVWITAPSRAYGAVHKFPWQSMLAELPHCVFDASGPLRRYSPGARAAGLFAAMAQLSAIGALAGAGTTLATQGAIVARHATGIVPADWTPTVASPDAARASAGLAAYFALNANARYQLLGGMDRYLFGHTSALWTYLLFTGIARLGSQAVGELSRPAWQGLPTAQAPRALRTRKVRRKKVSRSTGVTSSKAAAAAAGADASSTSSTAAAVVTPAAAAAAALADYAPVAAPSSGVESGTLAVGEGSSTGYSEAGQQDVAATAAAASLADYRPISAADGTGVSSLQDMVESTLEASPAVMGSLDALRDVSVHSAREQQASDLRQLEHALAAPAVQAT